MATKSKPRPLARIDAATLAAQSEDARRAYFKRTSPADDAYFFASALNRQGYADRALRVYSLGEQYESGYLNRAAVFAGLQIERFGWGRDRTAAERGRAPEPTTPEPEATAPEPFETAAEPEDWAPVDETWERAF